MSKKTLLPLWLAMALTVPAQQADAVCTYPSTSNGHRHLASFTLTDGSNEGVVAVDQGTAVYHDRKSSALETFPGSKLSFSSLTWDGSWMHGYLYVDYNGDGDYNIDANNDGTGDGELVSYTYYKGSNILGETASNGAGISAESMPAFNLPANLEPGDYTALFKIDWDNIDPCGASDMAQNAGCAVEFTIRVKAPVKRTVTVNCNDETMGAVAIEGYEGTTVEVAGPVVLKATPFNGYSFINWILEDGSVYSDLNPVSVSNDTDITLTAVFDNLRYPEMKRTFTGSASQENRYLKSVTTLGTKTPVVFDCETQADLPYTAFSSTPGIYVASGANIDKTANPIVVENGTTSFQMTYTAWTSAINGRSSEINWTQEAYFVDWNGDGLFDGANEVSEKGWTTMPHGDILTGTTRTVNIPEGQAPGTYRMRVVFYEPANSGTLWNTTLFNSLRNQIRNGISYDMNIVIAEPKPMTLSGATFSQRSSKANPDTENVVVATLKVVTDGSLEPLHLTEIKAGYTGTSVSDMEGLRWIKSDDGSTRGDVVATANAAADNMSFTLDSELRPGDNYYVLLANVAPDAAIGNVISLNVNEITIGGNAVTVEDISAEGAAVSVVYEPDYTRGNALWFDTPNSSTAGASVWNYNDFSSTDTNPDQTWERKSFPIGNGSFGGNVLGSVNRERVVLNEKTLWKGGPGTGAESYWDMNRTVTDATLGQIRTYLENGQNSMANSLVASNYSGKINYDRNKFGVFTTMGEAYVSTGINESAISDYKRIMNIDRSLVVVQFNEGDNAYTRKYFASYPDNVMVWNYSADAAQNLTFSFNSPQNVTAVEATEGGLIYKGKLDNNSMQWAMRVYVRVNGEGTVTPNATARTISVAGATDVDFILAADTDYKMNFNPSTSDAAAFVGEDPVANVNGWIEAAAARSYDELYARHYEDYAELYNRTELAINPSETFENLPTPTRLSKYRQGSLDHGLEQMYFQYGRYLLISSSRAGNMPANLQGMWHNNTDGPWRVDYHNNINLQMNYWPATTTNLLECFTPFVDYVRGLVEPGKRTAKSYYGARGWTAEVSTNIFGFTAPLNSTDMSWNYNPTAGPWLASQIWEYYDYTRDKQWLREIGYDIIKESANFCSDLLYFANGTYTSAPSYSPEHGTADLGATYANAVTREVLKDAIEAATILGVDEENVAEWTEKLNNMYPYQVGKYGQLQEWYRDIDTYGDTHRHTNHLFGLHPGTTINALTDTELVDACKETLRQRGDAATGWSMGWKLNHWARLLDGDHAYILFQNLLKNGTADNMWDLHPPFQIDGNFGGTAGIAELFLQSQNGKLHLLPALPSQWTDGHVSGLLARGNFEVDIFYAGGKLEKAVVRSGAGEKCDVYYNGSEISFPTVEGAEYTVTVDADGAIKVDNPVSIDTIFGEESASEMAVYPNGTRGGFTVALSGNAEGNVEVGVYTVTGQCIRTLHVDKPQGSYEFPVTVNAAPGVYIIRANGAAINAATKVVVK